MFVPYELEIVALLASSDTLISSHFILFYLGSPNEIVPISYGLFNLTYRYKINSL